MKGGILYAAVLIFLAVSAIAPADRLTWCLETAWVTLGLTVCAVLYFRKIPMTSLLQLALCIHAGILIYGGWYTYELTPLGEWMKDIFGFTRNNYDRIGHFAQGFFPAVLYREVIFRNNAARKNWWAELFVFAMCMAFTAFFEEIEFLAAVTLGNASDAYLGSQGDIWDAQWDMLYCGIGALFSIIFLRIPHIRALEKLEQKK